MKLDLVIQALNRKTMAHEHNCRNFLPVHNSCQPLQIQNPCNQPQFRAPYQQTPVQHHCIQNLDPQLGLSTASSCSCSISANSSSAPLHPHLDPQLGLSTASSWLKHKTPNGFTSRFIHMQQRSYYHAADTANLLGHQTYCRGLHSFPHFGLVPVARYIHTRRNTTQKHRPTKSAKLPIDHHSSPAIGHSTNSHHRPNLQQSSRSNPHSNFLKLHSTCPSFPFPLLPLEPFTPWNLSCPTCQISQVPICLSHRPFLFHFPGV